MFYLFFFLYKAAKKWSMNYSRSSTIEEEGKGIIGLCDPILSAHFLEANLEIGRKANKERKECNSIRIGKIE
jgi:hypothetical protein